MRQESILINVNELKHIINIKMDLGWKREDFAEFCEKSNERIEVIQGKTRFISILNNDHITKIKQTLRLSEDLKYHIRLVSNLNISKDKLNK